MENCKYGMERVKRVWNMEIFRSMSYHAPISLSHIRLLVYAMTRLIFSGLLYIAMYLTTSRSSESSCNQENPCPLTGGEPLPRCPELVSKDGFLDVKLTVEIGYFQFDWLQLPRRSYNGLKCPPTWRVKPGDRINVTVVNELEDGAYIPDSDPVLNFTNLHTHGLHISPQKPQDYVFLEIKPGESYQYSYLIQEDHAAGTYWYHAHHHGSTTIQITGGMAGMLIVEDRPGEMERELKAVSCPEHCEHDIFMMISPMLMMQAVLFVQNNFKDGIRFDPSFEKWLQVNVNEFIINGELHPVVSVNRNQLTRFRFLHVGMLSPIEMSIVDEAGGLAPCQIREIARDGMYFDEPKVPRKGQSVLFAGNRLDWLIKCSEIGTFQLYSHAKEQHKLSFAGLPRRSGLLATVEVSEANSVIEELSFPATLPSKPRYVNDLRNVVPDQYITVEIGGSNTLNREHFSGPTNYRYKVEVDSVVEIQMINTDYRYSHPIHFHVNHMQVLGFEPYNGPVALYKFLNPVWELRDITSEELCYYQHSEYIKGAAEKVFNVTDPLKYDGHYTRWKTNHSDSLAYPETGQWVDTVFSPALSNITLRVKMDRYTGPLQIHCHTPLDSDLGMSMVIEVVEKGTYLGDANILSGGSPPGSCRKCDWNRFVEMPPECNNDSEQISRNISRDVIMNLLMTLLGTSIQANATRSGGYLN